MIIQTDIAILGGEVAVENALGHAAAFDAKTVPFQGKAEAAATRSRP